MYLIRKIIWFSQYSVNEKNNWIIKKEGHNIREIYRNYTDTLLKVKINRNFYKFLHLKK